ncbi:tandem-95 repeat protein [Clostridium sp. YIM B02505]|uniref:Tandem-95 repeat protein n=1 Tax=Clostridium yunnanense TaxID=2800325 RepID=A0ABS1ELZ2_9CLOT|nr:Ig-like domain-containing protein [Clostridium yunnanense]MBK1810396.1 tandem-95 repeat protein [Clostridium yunnanense]
MLRNKKKLMVLIALAATVYNGYMHTTVVKAEGSRELVNTYNQSTNQYVNNGGYRPFLWASTDTTAGITRKTTFNVYVKQGETLNFGSSVAQTGSILVKKPGATSWSPYTVSSSGSKAGFIENVAQEKIGANAGGYVPITLNVGATEAGIWQFQFVGPTGTTSNPTFQKGSSEFLTAQKSTIAAWDVTVKDSEGNEKKGRMYAPYIAMIMGTNSTTNSSATSTSNAEKVLNNDFYVLTKDGYVYQTSMNGIDPNGFVFWSNNRGYIDKTNDKTLYHSIMDGGTGTEVDKLANILGNIAPQLPTDTDTETNITHKVFVNNPNKDLPANLSPVAISPAIPENFNFKGSSNVDLKTNVSTGGNFTFIADKAGSYRLTINTDGSEGYNLSTDMVIENVCRAGVNTITWDGKDKNGNKLPIGTYTAQLIMKGGEYHFPMLDAEHNPFGIKVKLINAPGYSDPETYADKYKVYYDESNYTSANGTSVNLDASKLEYHINKIVGLSGVDSSQGAHGYFQQYGNGKGIDTWTYFPGTPATLSFEVTPVSANIAKSGVEDIIIPFTIADFTSKFTDGANNSLNRIKIVDLPANGTLKLYGTPVTIGQEIIVLNLSGLTFTPNKDWNGNTSFNWNGSNGSVYSANNASVSITVTPVNDAPVASNDTSSTNENTPIDLSVLNNDSDVERDTLTITSVTNPTHGTAVENEDGTIRYTPNTNYKGEDSFSYTISDGHGGTSTATVNITVNAVNNAPNVGNVVKHGLEDTDVNFTFEDFINRFADIDEDALTKIRIESLPSNGVLKLNGANVRLGDEILVLDLSKLTFTPNSNWNGSTSFQWNGNDGTVYANESGTVNITVVPVNDAPVALNDIATVSEDGTVKVSVLNNDSDVERDTLTITSVTKPAHGTAVINEDGTISYTPDANYNGTDSFNYTISDGHGGTNTATVNITVNAVNDAPVVVNDTATVSEDGTVKVSVLNNDSDVDGDQLTITSVTKPAHGTAVVNEDGTISYTPDANYNGNDSFTYTVSDGHGGTNIATVNVTVNAVNDAPTVSNIVKSGLEDTDINFNGGDFSSKFSDIDGNSLTKIKIESLPSEGVLKLNGVNVKVGDEISAADLSNLTFTPNSNWNGNTSFKWNGNDGIVYATETGTVNINVTPVNDTPVSAGDIATVLEDGTVKISVLTNDSDVDGDLLTITSVTNPEHGTAVVNEDGTISYTPDANYNGADSFTYTVSDGHGGTNTATVNITVNAVNDEPTVGNIAKSGLEDTNINFKFEDFSSKFSDVDGNNLVKVRIESLPTNGVLKLNGNEVKLGDEILVLELSKLTFTPNSNWNGSTSFRWNGNDGTAYATESGTVDITITPVNDAPVAVNDKATVSEDGTVKISVLNNDSDVDRDALTITSVTKPAHGTAVINEDGTVSYTPDANYNGTDSFSYTISDGHGGTSTATVNITVNAVNDAPVASNDTATVSEDGTVKVSVLNNDGDVDGDALTITSVTKPAHGTAVINEDGTVSYTPDANYNGTDSFSYTISDGHGGTSTATVNITVNAVNDAPVAVNDTATVSEDGTVKISVLNNDSDVDRDTLTITSVTKPAHGTAVINEDGTISYKPDANYNATDSFSYTISDGHGGTSTATVSITVNAVNDAPTAPNYSRVTPYNKSVTGRVVGNDIDGDRLEYSLKTSPVKGYVEVDKTGVWTYVPNINYVGTDSFAVEVSDGHGGKAVSTIDITVRDRADLVGTVVNKTTGKVIPNTAIQLSDQSGHVIYTTTTDSNGNYTINNVKLGIYGFKVSNPSYETQNIDFDIEPTSETNYTVRKDFQVYEAIGYSLNLTANPTTILGDGKATTVLSAKIVDKNNNPLANVEVNFSAAEGSFPNGTVAITDKNGIATILFKSSKVDGTQNRNIPVIATVNDKAHNLQVSDQIVMVFEPGIISGLVVDNETGRPVTNAIVEVSKDFDGDGIDDFYSKMITGADGRYAIAIPKGNVQYRINVTKPVRVGSSYVNVKFTQNNQTGNITGAGNEDYSSVNTAAGVILVKQPNGNVSLLSDSSVFSVEVVNKSDSSSLDKGKISLNNGVFEAEGLEKGKVYTVAINYTFPSGEKIVVGAVNVTVDSDGQLNLSSALIDPYGTITDALTKNNIDGAKVQLYYADTARNRAAGRIPNTLVNLPKVPGFAPADNLNPQLDDINGKYAFMVFPDTDYYLVVTKDGYDTFTSETISVAKEIVKRDIQMNQQKKQPDKQNSEPTKIVAELPKTGSPIGTEAISLIGFIALAAGIGVLTAAKKKN